MSEDSVVGRRVAGEFRRCERCRLQTTSQWPAIPHYRITQHPLCFLWSPLSRLCLVAASKTSSTPSPVSDEHSRYFFAPMRLRTSSPSSDVRNFSDRLRISSCATGSSRRSFFRPTRMIGTPGQRSRTSGCLVLLLDRCHRKSGGGFATANWRWVCRLTPAPLLGDWQG